MHINIIIMIPTNKNISHQKTDSSNVHTHKENLALSEQNLLTIRHFKLLAQLEIAPEHCGKEQIMLRLIQKTRKKNQLIEPHL